MADESTPPSNPPDGNPPNPAPAQVGVAQPKEERPAEVSPKSVFVNSQPIREDQVQNAVQFLSHPRVKGSPVVHRRNFLERKGLTKEEIDEAFRRVPDPSPDVANAQVTTTTTNQYGQPPANNAVVNPSQVSQPSAAPPSGIMATVTRRFHWSYALLAIGFVAASGYGSVIVMKKAIMPRFKSWVRRVVSDDEHVSTSGKPSPAKEAAAAAKAAAAAAADLARVGQDMLASKTEDTKLFAELKNFLDGQGQEMRSMRNSMRKLEGQAVNGRSSYVEEDYLAGTIVRSRQASNVRAEYDSRPVRSLSPPVSSDPPHPKSYMEIMAMIQRGERPPNIRDINDAPPNPNQPISDPNLAPRTKPWETVQPPSTASFYPQSPFVNQGSNSSFQGNGVSYQLNNESLAPWWSQEQQKNVDITEVGNEDNVRTSAPNNGEVPMERPPQRKWVPPQAPPVALPEAADAIRRPKSSVVKDLSAEEVSVQSTQTANEVDELQRITKISESGGEPEMNGERSEIGSSSEIQEQVES